MKLKNISAFIISILTICVFFTFTGVGLCGLPESSAQAKTRITKTHKHNVHKKSSNKRKAKHATKHKNIKKVKGKQKLKNKYKQTKTKSYKPQARKSYKPVKYREITISKGNLLRALVRNRISTATNNVNDPVYLIFEDDFYVGNYNCIPQNSILVGKIKELVPPQIGTNAVLKILFYNIIFPDNKQVDVTGHIWSKTGDSLGGELTSYAQYRRVPNISERVGPIMQLLPAGQRQVGTHVVLNAGDEKVIVLDSDLKIKIKE